MNFLLFFTGPRLSRQPRSGGAHQMYTGGFARKQNLIFTRTSRRPLPRFLKGTVETVHSENAIC